jgi:hypothetical protein
MPFCMQQANAVSYYYNANTGYLEQHVLFVGQNGSVIDTWWDGQTWSSRTLPGQPASDPVALRWAENIAPELHVFFLDASGGIGHAWFAAIDLSDDLGWSFEVLPGSGVGGAITGASYTHDGTPETAEMHVFYVQSDGLLHQTWLAGDVWSTQPLSGSPQLQFGLSAQDFNVPAYTSATRQLHVYYVGQSGLLEQTFWNSTSWVHQELQGNPYGIPSAIVCDDENVELQNVFFAATDGSLQETKWLAGSDWTNTVLPGSFLGDDVYAAEIVNSSGVTEMHVYYVGSGGALGETWWDGSNWNQNGLPGRPTNILGVGNYYPQNGPTEQHVFFRHNDGSLQRTWWDGNSWNNESLPAASPPRNPVPPGRTDIALTAGPNWASIPVAFSVGDGTFQVTNASVQGFATFAAEPGVRVLTGDFNGNGCTDIALTGNADWASIPVAFSNGDGTFNVTNASAQDFATWAAQPGAKVVTGDFNGDGLTGIALTGVPPLDFIAQASSVGDGTFNVTSGIVQDFAIWAAQPGVKVLTGDFDGDGRTDIALCGVPGWDFIAVAFSEGDGVFRVTNASAPDFATWAAQPGVEVLTGDFDGDGRTDIALTGVPGWASIPVAFSNGDGTFKVTNASAQDFATWAAQAGAIACSMEMS